jgi:hypothetical protein
MLAFSQTDCIARTDSSGVIGPAKEGEYAVNFASVPLRPSICSGVAVKGEVLDRHFNIRDEGGIHTILVETNFHHSGRETQEQNTILLVLSAVLGRDHVHRGLGYGVEGPGRQIIVVCPLHVCEATGDGDDLLDVALEDKWKEQVEQMNVGDDIDLEQVFHSLLKLLGPVTTSC